MVNAISRVNIVNHLYKILAEQRSCLLDLIWEQHSFHEKRRWSAVEMIDAIDLENLTEFDKVNIWNAGRAELTTKPGADRLARVADVECRRWQESNPALASVMQACSTWSRYWNEEESFHESTLNRLSNLLGLETVNDRVLIEFRKIFPDDDMLRTLVLLAISEITATVNYSYCASVAQDPGLKKLFKQIAADEAQHMTYFISFAKALVDSQEYSPKGAFAVTHLFVREGGELYGSKRQHLEQRDSHVNWWDTLKYDMTIPDNIERKQGMIFSALRQITGIEVNSAAEVEQKWLELVGC
ncbi:acyl-ACP desaturase [Nostoc sp. C117]|uniref:acyl-ACP desaturase n=1 Tax=Nostoc sp. C117 TaxID=3349875 RepID=UPI00370D8C14